MCSAYNHRFGVRIMHNCLFQEALNTKRLCHKSASFDHSPDKIFRDGKQVRKTDLHA